MWEDSHQLNEFNHCNRGNPHDQYNYFKTYISSANSDNTERYVKIFEGNFHLSPSSQNETVREYNRLLYRADLYSAISDEIQSITEFSLLCMIKYDNTFYYEIANKTTLGSTNRTINLYYKTDSDTGITNVKAYCKVSANNEHVIILPRLYDTASNNKTPYHLKASGKGATTRQKLDDLYSDFSMQTLLTATTLATAISGYTTVSATANETNRVIFNGELNNATVKGDSPGVNFIGKDGTNYGSLYYSKSAGCYYYDTQNHGLRLDGSLTPLGSNRSCGADWSPWYRGFFTNGVQLGTCTTITRPTGMPNGFTIFDSDLKKLIVYYSGAWYNNGAVV